MYLYVWCAYVCMCAVCVHECMRVYLCVQVCMCVEGIFSAGGGQNLLSLGGRDF